MALSHEVLHTKHTHTHTFTYRKHYSTHKTSDSCVNKYDCVCTDMFFNAMLELFTFGTNYTNKYSISLPLIEVHSIHFPCICPVFIFVFLVRLVRILSLAIVLDGVFPRCHLRSGKQSFYSIGTFIKMHCI